MAERIKEKKRGEMLPQDMPSLPGVFDEMDRLMDRYLGSWGLRPSWMPRFVWPEEMEATYPRIDVFEEADEVVVKAELPGIEKDSLDVEITEDSVVVSGEKQKEEKLEKKDYFRMERSFGSFKRKMPLPTEIKAEKAKAVFKDGILEIRAPKKALEKKVRVEVE
jgi:HSP20 family protein